MIYIESIKQAPISCMTKSHKRIDLFKGLNKLDDKDWAEAKEMPLIKAYLDAETLKERKDIRAVSEGESKEVLEKSVKEGKKDVKPIKTKSEKVVAKAPEHIEVAEEIPAEIAADMSDESDIEE